MPIKHVFDQQQQFLHVKASGQMSTDDFKSTVKEILSSEDYPPDIATLWDLQNFDFSVISSKFEKSIIDIHKKYSARGKTRIAMLVSGQLGASMCMMYKSLSSMYGIPHEFEVFHNINDAKSWLTGGHQP